MSRKLILEIKEITRSIPISPINSIMHRLQVMQ